jgi:adenine-specific DNA methylase
MTLPYRKKLIEVALPLKAINDESALRKRKAPAGYPTTLHKWWAQRPLAACRAVLFASLVDDPDSDPAYRTANGTVDEDRAGIKRAELFNLTRMTRAACLGDPLRVQMIAREVFEGSPKKPFVHSQHLGGPAARVIL